ncbi:L10-interacting MYB domain-containing protein-like [Lolium rigidum]|nr:L10-interacting MYB domain-containing protein-like [Lolium rigidum]
MPEAEWNDEHTTLICELFVEQVRAGNRPNTHINNTGYSLVAQKFEQRTQLLYTKTQLKNKWDKLKRDYINWKELLARGAGLGWNNGKGTIAADKDWWKNTCTELPGAKKFRRAGIKNENHLKVMFEDIISSVVDHSSPAADSVPSAPDSTLNVENLDRSDNNVESFSEDNHVSQLDHNDVTQLGNNDAIQQNHDPPSIRSDVEESHGTQLDRHGDTQLGNNGVIPLNHDPPSIRNKRRPIHVNTMENKIGESKRNKTETALLMQAQLKRIVELV